MMKKVLGAVLMLAMLMACNTIPKTESVEQLTHRLDRAEEARETLWGLLQSDKDKFTEDEWATAETLHLQAVQMASEIEVESLGNTMPSAAMVDEWLLMGYAIYVEAGELLTPKLSALQPKTRVAWVIEKSHLRRLHQAGQAYRDNPNTGAYQAFLNAGLLLGKIVIGI